jgi:hypothetical protein
VKAAAIALLILLSACAGERLSIGKNGMAQRDNRPRQDRPTPPRIRLRTIAFERHTPLAPVLLDHATAALSTPRNRPDQTPAPPQIEAAMDLTDDLHLVPAQAISDPQTVQEEAPERTRWNWWAPISSLILIGGLTWAISLQSTELLILAGLVAFVIALISARKCRDEGLKGQGFALITMVLAGVTLLVGMLSFLSRFL